MHRAAEILRMLMMATVAMFLILSGLDQSAAALHDVEHGHQDSTAAAPSSDHPDPTDTSCHGVLLCLAAVEQARVAPSQLASTRHLKHRKHSNLLSHLAHPPFDPPPPRISV